MRTFTESPVLLHHLALDLVQVGIETHNRTMTDQGLDLCAVVIKEAFK